MATSEQGARIPGALWAVLLLAGLAGLGLLAKHYRITREGETPEGPFAVSGTPGAPGAPGAEEEMRGGESGARRSPKPGAGRSRRSEHGLLEATLGDVEVVVRYGRPEAGGQAVWGERVPFGTLWRIGAEDRGGEPATITFSGPVEVEGVPVSPGTYALLTIPDSGEWTVILAEDPTSREISDEDPSKVRRKVRVEPEAASFTETLTFVARDDGVALRWGELAVPIRIEPAG
ncbi:MAG: DUF2911 domain-containing protein [Thermoanaerobaculia bacterium]|nr:DUF2911 domain-containing protein [Thermoanaerobaculia bacterium]